MTLDNVFGITGQPYKQKYVLNVQKDVDVDQDGTHLLWLPYGWRFSDEVTHVRGYDSLAELKKAVKTDVVPCECADCVKHPRGKHIGWVGARDNTVFRTKEDE